MKRKDLLLVTFLLSQTMPVWAMDPPENPQQIAIAPRVLSRDEVIRRAIAIQNAIQDVRTQIREAAAQYPEAVGSVIVLGKIGSGKSALITGIASTLKAEAVDGELRLNTDQPLPGINIHRGITAGTRIPSAWYDRANRIIYWDCPGFEAPSGADDQIINARVLEEVFKNLPAKVGLVVPDYHLDINIDRGTHFFQCLNETTKLFPNQAQLENILSFIVTKGGQKTQRQPQNRLRTLQGELSASDTRNFNPNSNRASQGATGSINPQLDLSQEARDLLKFLITHNNHIASFPKPKTEGSYQFDKAKILDCIMNNTQYVQNLTLNLQAGMGSTAKLQVIEYAQALNDYLTGYMKTEAPQQVINSCLRLIDEHQGSVGSLRATFDSWLMRLQALRRVSHDTPLDFVGCLNTTFNTNQRTLFVVDDIRKTIDALIFFRKIRDSVMYQVADWSTAFLNSIEEKLQKLSAGPKKVDEENGAIRLEGILVGTSDLNAALRANPDAPSLNGYSVNTLFIDEDMVMPAKSASFVAPSVKLIGEKTIDLSGRSRVNGADGRPGTGEAGHPGKPGQHSGHFYAKALQFNDLLPLTIKANGGHGGGGGNGADGADGAPGRDGDLRISTNSQPYHKVHWQPGDLNHIDSYGTRHFFQDQGTNGQPGQNGGQGGEGAPGGHPGIVLIDGHPWNHISQNGQNGQMGSAGLGGQGGDHGRHCIGRIVTGMQTVTQGQPPVPSADLVEVPSSHLPRNPTRALKGVPGIGLNHMEPQPLAIQQPFNVQAILEAYPEFYLQAMADEATKPFVTPIPEGAMENIPSYHEEIDRQRNVASRERQRNADQDAEAEILRERQDRAAFRQAEEEAQAYADLVAAEQVAALAAQAEEEARRDQEVQEAQSLERLRDVEEERQEREKRIIEDLRRRSVVVPAPVAAVPPTPKKAKTLKTNPHTKKKVKHHGTNKVIHKIKKLF